MFSRREGFKFVRGENAVRTQDKIYLSSFEVLDLIQTICFARLNCLTYRSEENEKSDCLMKNQA